MSRNGLSECNYLQGLEGESDSSHLSFLHRVFAASGRRRLSALESRRGYETEKTDFGVRLIATRIAGHDSEYVRVSSFVMPITCWVPARNRETHIYVPSMITTLALRSRLSARPQADGRRLESPKPNRPRLSPAPKPTKQLSHKIASVRRPRITPAFENFLNHDGCATEIHGSDL